INDQEYLEVKYADQDKLFVPMGSLDRIEKFQVEPGLEPEIYKLGRKGFRKRRERLQDDMAKFALEIIEVQARRKLALGHRFGRDTLLQEEFEEAFPYNLTPDQNRAVEDTKRDMESGRVMDRIICGDVGCGKTEVAIRAAFKAAMDGKQVALMVPTTVLAQQHYERIVERLKNYPVTVELLSRIKTERELEECYKKIASGGIDIVVGTHKILSSEINFKDLGLVIIDEEQKFGVKAKEKLKTLRTNVHMLTLTATPIPRTLNLALLGIRDISIIETLPEGRLPIQDYFIEKKDEAIRDAVMREFAREGQSFYIYNRVKGIERREEELRKMLPGFLKIDHIHGQMPPREIREILHQFENGEIDLLLATTIVENGIDVENANSIIIEGTDKLGLSQMYQLRGRVGRGHERGYCYFLTDPGKDIRSKVKQREESMRSLGEMGAGTGFNLSMEDMRIRGAGEVLGERQHGAIEILGYGLYMKLLQEEIAKLKGEYIEELPEFTLDLTLPRYIPDTYIEEREKLILYKRIAQIGK
ncbi:MAG: DEAD/DEAH box helicase, partial [Fusobacteriaceae bacterium]